jgi:hypothetical protein
LTICFALPGCLTLVEILTAVKIDVMNVVKFTEDLVIVTRLTVSTLRIVVEHLIPCYLHIHPQHAMDVGK